ncbi:uncharacterized protein LOC129219135 [Uloborus diversus]|uniref:uncharacterized protein LOC129219135 n=1 Tax=Uloborus diversus TaxID=327109 RepID=UPI002409CCF9|nr:uncharacterized protein LOC129219135 [Uloborus diversus]
MYARRAILFITTLIVCFWSIGAHKYSTPVDKVSKPISKSSQPPVSSSTGKKYVDFDLKSQSSYYDSGEPSYYQHHYSPDHKNYDYGYYGDHYPYHYGKDYDHHHMIPFVVGGFVMLMLPLLTILLTLAVNIAPATNIPTAVTTATGKLLSSFNSTRLIGDILDQIDSAMSKYS